MVCTLHELILAMVLQAAVRDVVGAGGSEATWRELSGLTPGSRVQVRIFKLLVGRARNIDMTFTIITTSRSFSQAFNNI